jgi:DNA-binding CsgD family transcriptional regulator
MDKVVSQFSLEFRDLIVKVIKEDFFLNKSPKYDKVFLAEKYKSIVDHINGFILIANYQSGLYEYVSDGIFPHLGYDIRPYKTNESLTDFIISIIKPEHRDFLVNNLLPTVLKYFKEHSTQATGTDFRYTCCMRLKNIYDVYHPVRTLVTATNISQFKKDELVYYNILKKNQDGVYEVMLEGTADNNISELQLTPRELQIINLISQGLTNKEIASKLFISLNTVQTHRKSIMRKTKCSGTAELTNFAFTRGLL